MLPKTCAGARIYFWVPLRSQDTTAISGDSVEPPCKFACFVQSSAAYLAFKSGVTPVGKVALFASAAAVVAFGAPSTKTWRNLSSAV